MGLTDVWPLTSGRTPDRGPALPDVVVLEDDPQLAELAVELCGRAGLSAATFASPADFLGQVSNTPPRFLILDWQFERELGAAVFMAVRHRFGDLPIVCWTATPAPELPDMLADDGRVLIVQKSGGMDVFDAAVRWAAQTAPAAGEQPPEWRTRPMMEGFKVPRDPHPGEPDELTPDTHPIDEIERPHDGGQGPDDPPERPAKDLDEPGAADRTPRP